jgi:large exoprotein involved in heme utilization and adhesion
VGDSGDVFITLTGRLYALGGNLGASSFSANNAGVITVRAPEVVMEQSTIATSATAAGSPGRVLIETGRLVFDRVNMLGSSKDGGGDGVIQLRSTGDLLMRGAIIFSNALGLANGGVVMIEGKSVEMINTLINSDTFAFGAAGRIELRADTLHLENTQITSTTDGEGVGGAVSVFGRAITLDTSSALRSDTTRLAKAGSVAVTATERLDLLDLAAVTSQAASGTGDGGSVSITAGRLFMADATISSDSLSLGRAGTVAVKADQIELDGRNREFTGISSDSFGFGDAGSVTIDARSLTVRDKAYVSSTGIRDGRAGDITIRTGDLSVSRGGTISSLGVQTDGGDISIVATGNLTVTSEPGFGSFIASAASGGDAGDLSLDVGGTLLLDASALSSDTFGPGDAGDLMIKAAAITLKSMSAISSSTGSFGNAGALTIEAKTITMDAGTQILSAATSMSEGDARSITIRADTIAVGKDATITTATFGRGDAGKVDITARSLRIDGGEVSSSAGVGSQGVAGDVRIAAGDLSIVNGGILSTLSANSNTAGELRISADQVSLDGLRSIISSENLADDRGDAGEIFITAKGVRVANGAGISTNSVAGAAGNIDIRVARPGLLVLEGGELPGLILTSSGPGTGGMITIADPLAIISNGGRILALGEQRGANVQISSRFFINSSDRSNVVDVAGDFRLQTGLYDVSSGTVSRDLSVLDASKVLQGQCPVARSTGLVSQLITRPVGPYVRDTGLEAAPARAGATNPGACP